MNLDSFRSGGLFVEPLYCLNLESFLIGDLFGKPLRLNLDSFTLAVAPPWLKKLGSTSGARHVQVPEARGSS